MPLKVKTVRAGGLKVQVVKTTTTINQNDSASSTTVITDYDSSIDNDTEQHVDSGDKNNNNTLCKSEGEIITLASFLQKPLNTAANNQADNNCNTKIKPTIGNTEKELQHQQHNRDVNPLVGDIVWSKIPGHCWWPSMITYDPIDAVFFKKFNANKTGSTKFHVQFFGDKSLRGWVFKSGILNFQGKEHFQQLGSKVVQKGKLPTSGQRSSWDNAIIQAEKALKVDRNERLRKYVFSYNGNNKESKLSKPSNQTKNTSNHQKVPKYRAGNSQKNCLKKEPPIVAPATNNNSVGGRFPEVENCSDSGIEDIGENTPDFQTAGDMDVTNAKRKRKQKTFSDYHTGEEFTLAIKSTTWKPLPAATPEKQRKSSRNRKIVSNFLKESKAATAMLIENTDDESNIHEVDDAHVDRHTSIKEQDTDVKDLKKSHKRKTVEGTSCTMDQSFLKSKKIKLDPTVNMKKDSIVTDNSKKLDGKTHKKNINKQVLDSDTNSEDDKKIRNENFCSICEEITGELISCNGQCFKSFHFDCLGLSCKPKQDFSCDACQTNHHNCFLCKKSGDLIKCSQISCGKFYHGDCIDLIQAEKCDDKKSASKCDDKKSAGRFFCPHHSCKVCTLTAKSNTSKTAVAVVPVNNSRRLVKCIRCPTAYHQKTCLIAGCMMLTSQHMICDQHFDVQLCKKNQAHINVTWCFVCSAGGSLVCCDTCPASFHPDCTDDLAGVPDGPWQCQDCRRNKKPKYGEIVWVKFGVYRWWPALICFIEEIPEKILALSHSPGEFPVMFFGSHDYAWIHSGRVFKYEEGDKGGRLKSCNSLGKYFTKALDEAKQAYADFKKEEAQLTESFDKRNSKKPPPYRHIKMNRPVSCIRTILDQSEWPICECTGDQPCTGEGECLNRLLYFECSAKTCKAGDKCQNQQMQKCQYKKLKPFKCDGRGWGLRSEQEIKSGDFVIEYVGELIDEEVCQKRVKEYHENGISDYYFLTIDRDNIIDAYPKGNLSRFMNHSCDPNCETQKWTVNGEIRVGLFATRKIAAEEELCFNYHLDCMGNDKKQCKCGSANCSGYLGVKPKTQHAMSVAEKAQNKKKKDKERRKLKIQKKKEQAIVHDDECFVCTDGGDLILCSRGKCTKAYHLKCLNLDKNPHGKWQCPWHFCDGCGKLAKSMCTLCPNSYCKAHEDGEIIVLREHVLVCSDHSESERNTLLGKLRETNDSNITAESSSSNSSSNEDTVQGSQVCGAKEEIDDKQDKQQQQKPKQMKMMSTEVRGQEKKTTSTAKDMSRDTKPKKKNIPRKSCQNASAQNESVKPVMKSTKAKTTLLKFRFKNEKKVAKSKTTGAANKSKQPRQSSNKNKVPK